jgi:DNA-binding MarR family transcriptional regulator
MDQRAVAASPTKSSAKSSTGPSAAPDELVEAIASSLPFGHAVAFLVSQLGYAVSRRVRAELEDLSLEPRHFGLMRAVAVAKDLSQQALADSLHIPASSIVALLDQLEAKGFVRRRLDPADRRVRLVGLTEAGRTVLARAVELGVGIEAAVCQGFDVDQREALINNLEKVAANIGLTLGVHPGFDGTEKEAGPPRRPTGARD